MKEEQIIKELEVLFTERAKLLAAAEVVRNDETAKSLRLSAKDLLLQAADDLLLDVKEALESYVK